MRQIFDPSRVHLVDKVGKNLLIRGNEPLAEDNKRFAYEELGSAINVDLTSYDLVDVCLIDNVGERWAFHAEMASFKGLDPDVTFPKPYWPPYSKNGYNPRKIWGYSISSGSSMHQGGFVWWPIEGIPKDGNSEVYLSWPGWNFSGLIDFLGVLTKSIELPPMAVYFHCMNGADRTGAVHAGYLMKHKGLYLEEAEKVADASTKAGAPSEGYKSLVRAYAQTIGR